MLHCWYAFILKGLYLEAFLSWHVNTFSSSLFSYALASPQHSPEAQVIGELSYVLQIDPASTFEGFDC